MNPCIMTNCKQTAVYGDHLCETHRARQAALSHSLLDLHLQRSTYSKPSSFSTDTTTIVEAGFISVLSGIGYMVAGVVLAFAVLLALAPAPAPPVLDDRPAHKGAGW